ncbi:helix-turn-helix domain-containing protein [Gillisia hiemivivida]
MALTGIKLLIKNNINMELLTTKEVMHLLKIKSPTTLIKLERENEIKVAKRIGHHKRYKPADIQRYIDKRN